MDRNSGLIPFLAISLLPLGLRILSAEPAFPLASGQEGAVVQYAGLPVDVRFAIGDGIGVLAFGVSTKDGTVRCYDVGTNTWVLRDLYSRLSRVTTDNGKWLLAGQEPLAVAVLGLFDTEANAILLCRVWVPRDDGNGDFEADVWDVFDSNRNDRILDRRDLFPLPTPPPPPEPVVVEPPTVVVNVVVNVVVEVEDNDCPYPTYPPPPTWTPPPTFPPCTPTPEPPPSAISFPTRKPPTGNAERWGQANWAPSQFNHPGLSQDVMDMLNPSRLEDERSRKRTPNAPTRDDPPIPRPVSNRPARSVISWQGVPHGSE